jgi:hypothetical protein
VREAGALTVMVTVSAGMVTVITSMDEHRLCMLAQNLESTERLVLDIRDLEKVIAKKNACTCLN